MAHISRILSVEALKDPSLFADLSSEKAILLSSDYSKVLGRYNAYSFMIVGWSDYQHFNAERISLRTKFGLGNRRFSYKGMNDRVKLKALPSFLQLANRMRGFVLTFLIDAEVAKLFDADPLYKLPEVKKIKTKVFERLLRISHLGALSAMTILQPQQELIWVTDSDDIVSNDDHQKAFGMISTGALRGMSNGKLPNQVKFAATSIDDGDLALEDLVSIPDLVAGALCETFDLLRNLDLRVVSGLALRKPEVKAKTDLVCSWMSAGSDPPLKKFGVVIDRVPRTQDEFRPTFFSIKQQRSLVRT